MNLQLPLMDLEDRAALSGADLWGGFDDRIRQASARYPHDVILSGRLRSVGGDLWRGDWQLLDVNEKIELAAPNLGWEEALAAGVNWAQDQLAERYAPYVTSAEAEQLLVRFTQVDSVPAYGRLLAILKQRDAINRLAIRRVEADSIDVALWVRGGRSALLRGLSLGGELFLVERPVADSVQAMPGVPGQQPALPETGPAVDLTYQLLHR